MIIVAVYLEAKIILVRISKLVDVDCFPLGQKKDVCTMIMQVYNQYIYVPRAAIPFSVFV